MKPLALPIRARFVPLSGHPDRSPDGWMPCIPSSRFSAVLLAMDGALVLSVPAAGAGCRIGALHPACAENLIRPGGEELFGFGGCRLSWLRSGGLLAAA